jgi:hypothetical protein
VTHMADPTDLARTAAASTLLRWRVAPWPTVVISMGGLSESQHQALHAARHQGEM